MSVLPVPVGPTRTIFDLSSSTSFSFGGVHEPLVVVVNRHGHVTLRRVLPDDVLVEERLDLGRFEQLLHPERSRGGALPSRNDVVVEHDLVAVLDALVADRGAVRSWNMISTSERRAPQNEQLSPPREALLLPFLFCAMQGYFSRLESTSSIRPYSLASLADSQWSRSASFSILRIETPECAARISYSSRLVFRISRAVISMSEACPCARPAADGSSPASAAAPNACPWRPPRAARRPSRPRGPCRWSPRRS